ncbi:hypothetical protein LINPERPRIM_LOCUS21775 [Linum perenne]
MLDSKPCRCGTRKKDASSSSAGVAVSPSPITGPRSKLEKQEEQAVNTAPRVSKTEAAAPRIDMYIDLSYIYTNVLLHSTDSDLIFVATRTVLDLKQFIKEWPFIHESEHLLKLLVRIIVSKSLDFEKLRRDRGKGQIQRRNELGLRDCNELEGEMRLRGTRRLWGEDGGVRRLRGVAAHDTEKDLPLFVCSGCCLVLQNEGAAKVEMIEFGNGDEEDEYLMLSDCGFPSKPSNVGFNSSMVLLRVSKGATKKSVKLGKLLKEISGNGGVTMKAAAARGWSRIWIGEEKNSDGGGEAEEGGELEGFGMTL